MARLPDFIIIGAMKGGTTSLFRWLGEVPGCSLPDIKEPEFFCDDHAWGRGLDWYRSLFPDGPSLLTGEASVRYTRPEDAALSAQRIATTLPSAKLIFVARDPVARARSHYKHEVQRGREKRAFPEVLAVAQGGAYVARSRYSQSLGPFVDLDRSRLLIVDFEQLTGPDSAEWHRVLEFLGLPRVPRPTEAHNVSSGKESFTPIMRWLYDRRLFPRGRYVRLFPAAMRRRLRSVLVRRSADTSALLASAECAIPAEILRDLEGERRWIEDQRMRSDALPLDERLPSPASRGA